eukprot:gene20245-biopygen8538
MHSSVPSVFAPPSVRSPLCSLPPLDEGRTLVDSVFCLHPEGGANTGRQRVLPSSRGGERTPRERTNACSSGQVACFLNCGTVTRTCMFRESTS